METLFKKGPGRPPKAKEDSTEIPVDQPAEIIAEKIIEKSGKVFAKTVQLGIGVDLLGSAMSLNNSRGNVLEVTPLGIRADGKKSGRAVLIPWANIRGVELLK